MAWILVGFPLLVGVVYYAFRARQIHEPRDGHRPVPAEI